MNLNDVYDIIDDYSEATFEACKSSLYNKLGFFVLGKEDIRRIDLKEKLSGLLFKYKDGGIESKFALLADGILTEHIAVNSESREESYLKKAHAYSTSLKAEKLPVDIQKKTLENFVMVYLSFLCKYKEEKREGEEENEIRLSTCDVVFNILPDYDLDTIGFIYDELSIYESREEKKKIWKNKTICTKLTAEERVFLYVISTIMAYRVFQFEGEV